jgi:S-formylglutathione hydrolase FrmB
VVDASTSAAGSGEASCASASAAFVQALGALKIPVTVYTYGNGTHSVPYWQRDLERPLPLILKAVASAARSPRASSAGLQPNA